MCVWESEYVYDDFNKEQIFIKKMNFFISRVSMTGLRHKDNNKKKKNTKKKLLI